MKKAIAIYLSYLLCGAFGFIAMFLIWGLSGGGSMHWFVISTLIASVLLFFTSILVLYKLKLSTLIGLILLVAIIPINYFAFKDVFWDVSAEEIVKGLIPIVIFLFALILSVTTLFSKKHTWAYVFDMPKKLKIGLFIIPFLSIILLILFLKSR